MITPEQLKILYDKCKIEEYIDIGRLVTYINIHFQTQQEKKDKLLELYREKDMLSKNPYKNIDTKEIKPYYEWACELKTLEDKIKALEEELK